MPGGGSKKGERRGGRKKGTPNRKTPALLKRHRQMIERVDINIARVLEEFGHIAFLDVRGAFDESGNLLAIQDFPDALARSVAGIEFEEIFAGRGENRAHVGRVHKIKLCSKISALEAIGKSLGMFVEKVEHSGNVEIVISQADAAL